MIRNLTNLLKLRKETDKDKEIVWKHLSNLPFSLRDKKEAINILFDKNKNIDCEQKSKYSDINFIDCDGTVLYKYTWEEWENIKELPPIPTGIRHTNKFGDLHCTGWNWDYDGINFHNKKYIIDENGKIVLYHSSKELRNYGIVDIYGFYDAEANDIITTNCFIKKDSKINDIVYWFDDINDIENAITTQSKIIEYKRFDCKIDVGAVYVNEDEEHSESIYEGVYIIDNPSMNFIINYRYIKIISFGFKINDYEKNSIDYDSFMGCNIERISLPINTIFESGYGALGFCNIHDLNLNYVKLNTNSLVESNIGDKLIISPINDEILSALNPVSVSYIKFPKNIMEVYTLNTPYKCIFDFSDSLYVPILSESNALPMFIIVPDDLYDSWINETNWSNLSEYIVTKSYYDALVNSKIEYIPPVS